MNFPSTIARCIHSINRNFSTKSRISNFLVEKIVFTDERQRTIVAWHPKPNFPYELSLPLPDIEEPAKSALITNAALKPSQIFNRKHPDIARQELMNITHTTKHRWYPRARDKRAKNTPPDREYL